jgi:two-component system, cell cycle sensor histidine kinase and response regulator CckA
MKSSSKNTSTHRAILDRLLPRLLRDLGDVIWVSSPSGDRVEFVSDAFQEVYGRAISEFLADPSLWGAVVHPKDATIAAQSAEQLDLSGFASAEYRIVRPDGTIRWLNDHKMILYDPSTGAPMLMGGVARDVTASREAELRVREMSQRLEQTRRIEGLGRLAGNFAHEFNNLLLRISGHFDHFSAMEFPDESQSHLVGIQQAIDSASGLAKRLTALAPTPQFNPLAIDPELLLRSVTESKTLPPNAAKFSVSVEPGCPALLGDEFLLLDAIMKLCVNGVEATPEGGVLSLGAEAVHLDATDCARLGAVQPGEFLRLTIEDAGTGMDSSTLEKCCEPFFTTKPEKYGAGLGLAIASASLKQHHGALEIASTQGEGTVVSLYLPRTHRSAVEQPSNQASSKVAERAQTILVVEDDRGVREIVGRRLKKAGYQVMLAVDGIEALEVFEKLDGELDLVFMDVIMPRMGGAECWSRMVALGAKCDVMFTTGYSRDALPTVDSESGLDVLYKPYKPDELLKAIKRALSR